jgi:hypothetical protein
MKKFSNWLIKLILRSLPASLVEEINAASLDELDERGLIIWADGESDEN